MQINAPGVDQADDVSAWKWLTGDPGPQRAEEKPTGDRDNRGFIESKPLEKSSRDEDEETAGEKTRGKPSPRSGCPRDWLAQAESDTAGKGRGNHHGRKFHGARLKRTSVSMW